MGSKKGCLRTKISLTKSLRNSKESLTIIRMSIFCPNSWDWFSNTLMLVGTHHHYWQWRCCFTEWHRVVTKRSMPTIFYASISWAPPWYPHAVRINSCLYKSKVQQTRWQRKIDRDTDGWGLQSTERAVCQRELLRNGKRKYYNYFVIDHPPLCT